MKWYQHDPDAFACGVRGLSLEEVGAYILIIDALYSRDGDLPDDDFLLQRILQAEIRPTRRLKKSLIEAGKLWIDSGKIRAKRVESSLEVARKFSQLQSEVAKKGWKKRNEINGHSMPSVAMPIQPQPHKEEEKTNAKKHSSKRSGQRIPAGWQPSEADATFAQSLGLSPAKVTAEFVDYWDGVPGQRGLKANWSATYRNRCRQIADREGTRNGSAGQHRQKSNGITTAIDSLFDRVQRGEGFGDLPCEADPRLLSYRGRE